MKRLKVGLGIVGAGAFLVSLVSAPDLWWALILLAGASLGLGSFASEWLRRHQPATTPPPSDSEVNVPLTQSTKVADVELPSAEPGYSFRFSANVCYQGTPTEQHGNPAQLAAAVLLERVRELSRDYHPKEHTTAQYQLAAVLGKPAIDDTTGLTVWADNVVLTLDKEDLQRMRRLSSFDKDLRIWAAGTGGRAGSAKRAQQDTLLHRADPAVVAGPGQQGAS